MKKNVILMAAAVSLAACQSNNETITKSGLNPAKFETTVDGKDVALYTLVNKSGTEACITNYGGRIVSLMVPDKDGKLTDVVLGHDSIADYINIDGNFGALIGRYGNRINNGEFSIDGVSYSLPKNDFGHCLHGGPKGFHHSVWTADQLNDSTLVLSLNSPDGEAGFPGNVDVEVVYTLTSDNAIDIAYKAVTDKPTILNLTNHSYFNLSGNSANDILDEIVWFDAEGFTPIDSTFMTSGEIMPVKDTPFDFTTPKAIGRDINNADEQLANGMGYDHNLVLTPGRDISQPAAYIADSTTGIKMEVYTSEPGIQFYVGNFLDGTVKGKNGIAYPQRSAVCLESQHFPDSPNKADWPSVVVRPGETYTSHCKYKFTTL